MLPAPTVFLDPRVDVATQELTNLVSNLPSLQPVAFQASLKKLQIALAGMSLRSDLTPGTAVRALKEIQAKAIVYFAKCQSSNDSNGAIETTFLLFQVTIMGKIQEVQQEQLNSQQEQLDDLRKKIVKTEKDDTAIGDKEKLTEDKKKNSEIPLDKEGENDLRKSLRTTLSNLSFVSEPFTKPLPEDLGPLFPNARSHLSPSIFSSSPFQFPFSLPPGDGKLSEDPDDYIDSSTAMKGHQHRQQIFNALQALPPESPERKNLEDLGKSLPMPGQNKKLIASKPTPPQPGVLREIVIVLANLTSEIENPIHKLYSDIEDKKGTITSDDLEAFYTRLLNWLTPRMLRQNRALVEALQKFFQEHPESNFLPTLEISTQSGQRVVVIRVLACTLSKFLESKCGESWSSTKPVSLDFDLELLKRLSLFINFGFNYFIEEDPIQAYCLADFLGINTLLSFCRNLISCKGYPDLERVSNLAQFSTDLELKIKCLTYLATANFEYPSTALLPEELKKLNEAFKKVKGIEFAGVEAPYQQYIFGFEDHNQIAAQLKDVNEAALKFCSQLNIRILHLFGPVDLSLASVLKGFTCIDFLNGLEPDGQFLDQLLGSKTLLHLNLPRVNQPVVNKLIRNLKAISLKSLVLGNLNPEDLAALIEELPHNQLLEVLHISLDTASEEQLKKMGASVSRHSQLKVLFLIRDLQNPENIPKFAPCLKAMIDCSRKIRVIYPGYQEMLIGMGKAKNDPSTPGESYLKPRTAKK